jgi:hypothetical protein
MPEQTTPDGRKPDAEKVSPTISRPKSSENLGQEGTQSNIKRNVTDAGERKDRGP